jgi:hypothetical protein
MADNAKDHRIERDDHTTRDRLSAVSRLIGDVVNVAAHLQKQGFGPFSEQVTIVHDS